MTEQQMQTENKHMLGKHYLEQMKKQGLLRENEYAIARAKLAERFKPILA